MKVRPAIPSDTRGILRLYRRVAAFPGGLARMQREIDETYVQNFVTRSLDNGVILVAENPDSHVVGEIHAYSPRLFCFAHVLSELTIAVDPDSQRSGIGRLLFQSLLDHVVDERADIDRVELIARESNEKALHFYESLGFRREGRLSGRIRNVDGSFESDIPMGWLRPV